MSAGERWLVGIIGAVLAGLLVVILAAGADCPQGQQLVQTGTILISNGQGGFTYIPELACEPQ